MAVTLVGTDTDSQGGATFTLTTTIPAGVLPGDRMFLFLTGRDAFGSGISGLGFGAFPTGWTLLAGAHSFVSGRYVFTRTAEAGDESTNVTQGGTSVAGTAHLLLVAYSGLGPTESSAGWAAGVAGDPLTQPIAVTAGYAVLTFIHAGGTLTGFTGTYAVSDFVAYSGGYGGRAFMSTLAAPTDATEIVVTPTSFALPTVEGYTITAPALPEQPVAQAEDRLRSSLSETTGSLLEAVEARQTDPSVSEAYTYAQELDGTALRQFREVLRERDSAEVDFAYYPRPRQNIVMENQYTGLTVLGRLARYYPARIYDDVVSLEIAVIPAATAQQIITYVFEQWAADNAWFTYEPVPDLRMPMPGLRPSDYGITNGIVYAATITIAQSATDRRDALSILRDLLSPFPGTVLRQNSTGALEIVPVSGPDADEAPLVVLEGEDLYSVTIGKPDPFDGINRCVVNGIVGAGASEDVALMQPAWFQMGSREQFGRTTWYPPAAARQNLQPFTAAGISTLQEGLSASDDFSAQRPVLWPIGTDYIPAGNGISLVDSGSAPQITAAWSEYNGNSLETSGTGGLTILTNVVPFSGAYVDAFRWDKSGGEAAYVVIRARWNETLQGIEFSLGAAKMETGCFFGSCNGWVVEFTLNDASKGYTEGTTATGSFGFVGEDADVLPGAGGVADAVAASQADIGIVERQITISTYPMDLVTLYEVARAYVIQNITPKVTREIDLSTIGTTQLGFDTIGRLVQLPNGDVGYLTGKTYDDDFTARSWRATATVEVRDFGAIGALDPGLVTSLLLNDDGSYWQNDDGTFSDATVGSTVLPAGPAPLVSALELRGDVAFNITDLDNVTADAYGVTHREWYQRMLNSIALGTRDSEFDTTSNRPWNRTGASADLGLLIAFRYTGDLALLDEAVRHTELAWGNMTTSGGSRYWPVYDQIGSAVQGASHIATVAWALHNNRDLTSPAGHAYGTISDKYKAWLLTDFIPRWRTRTGTLPPWVKTQQHTYLKTMRLLHYVGRLGGGAGFTSGEYATAVSDMFTVRLNRDVVGPAGTGGRNVRIYRHNVYDGSATTGAVQQYTTYVRYEIPAYVDLMLELADPRLTASFFGPWAAAFADLVLDGDPGGTGIEAARSIGGDQSTLGVPYNSTYRARVTSTRLVTSTYNFLSGWDDLGVMEPAIFAFYPDGGTAGTPTYSDFASSRVFNLFFHGS